MKRIIALLAVIVLCVSVLAACGENNGSESGSEPGSTQDSKTPKLTDKTETVATPYVDLCVPESFSGKVESKVTKEDPYTLTFYSKADDTVLFEIVFNGSGDVLMGTVVKDGKNTVVYMNIPKLDKDNKNYDEYIAYQQAVNTITNHLSEDYDFRPQEELDPYEGAVFEIKTSIVTLHYPQKWKDRVKVNEEDGVVSFSDGETPLFDLYFKKCDGVYLGSYDGTPIYIVEHKAETDDQKAMQHAVNTIIESLSEDEKFVIG